MPTSNPVPTGKGFLELISKETGLSPELSVLSKWMISIVGIFNKNIGEIKEMLYENEFDYYFDSTKFENHFNYKPVSYSDGIKETIFF